MNNPRVLLVPILLLLTFTLFGQTYKAALAAGDLGAVEKQLTALGTTFKKEPVIAVYLSAVGKNAKFPVVKALVDQGADPGLGMRNPSTGEVVKPLALCIIPTSGVSLSPDQADIVRLLVEKGAQADFITLKISGRTVLDTVLAQVDLSPAGLRTARTAAVLSNENLRLSPRRRVIPDPRFVPLEAVLTDDIDQVRKLLQLGADAPEFLGWAIAAGSEKTAEFLFQMFGYQQDVAGLAEYAPYSPKILGIFLDQGLGGPNLYQYACQENRPEAVRQIRSKDTQYFWVTYVPAALAAGADCFNALTDGSKDFADSAGLKAAKVSTGQGPRAALDLLQETFYGKTFALKDVHDKVGAEAVSLILNELPPVGPDQNARVQNYRTKALTGLQFGPTAPGAGRYTVTVNEAAHAVAVAAPGGTNAGKLAPRVVFTGASVTPPSGTPLDFTGPVVYTVTADDGSTQGYTVTLKILKADKALTAFGFPALNAAGVIDEAARKVRVEVAAGTDLGALVPSVTVTGVSVAPASGTPANFTRPVVFRVTAEDGSWQDYLVTVSSAPAPTPTPVP